MTEPTGDWDHSRPRILALIDTWQVSGPGRQLAALASSLRSIGIDVQIVTFRRARRPRSPYVDHVEAAGIPCIVLEEFGPLDPGLVFRLQRLVRRLDPTLVQTHGYKTTALAFSLRRMGASWPWIAFSHGATAENTKVRFYNWLEERLFRATDRVVVMSRRHKNALSHLAEKTRVVHNAVIPLAATEPAGAHDVQLPAMLDPSSDAPVLGVIGRLSPEKGVDVFLRACRELAQRSIAFAAIIAGDGPERDNLLRLRDTLGLTQRVRFIGVVTAVERLYPKLDLVVIPSHSEGLPNVLLEALRADVPVVATEVGAIPDVLGSSRAGVLTRPGSATALADAIAQGLHLRDNAASKEARRVIAQRFSLERRVEAHLALYREVLRQANTRH